MMSQAPLNLSYSPVLSSLHHNGHKAVGLTLQSSPLSVICASSFAVLLATKAIAQKLVYYSRRVRWLRVHTQLFIIFSLPSLYLFTLSHQWSFFVQFLFLIVLSVVLVLSLSLSLPRFPLIRPYLACSFRFKSSSSITASRKRPPVIWSIGSKPKLERKPYSGSWVQVYSNGDVYEGEFHKGKCSGSGVFYYYMSGRYEGDWVDEKYDGHGVETWAKGSRYRGQYRQGLRHGYGVYRFFTGDVYSGEWCNGQCHGAGVFTCEDGSTYTGEFKWGVKHGLGHYNFRNGDTYTGEYFADQMHGFGIYNFANGHRYEGSWHEGRREGLGLYTFKRGETQSGQWRSGVLNISSIDDGSPTSFKLDHSKVLRAAQEAQEAAAKAGKVVKVDDRVNRAVAAANKAANAARVAAVKAVQNQMHCYENYLV